MTSSAGTFYGRYEALELEGPSADEVDESPSGTKGPLRAAQSNPSFTNSVKSKRRAVARGSSLLKEDSAQYANQIQPTGKPCPSLGVW